MGTDTVKKTEMPTDTKQPSVEQKPDKMDPRNASPDKKTSGTEYVQPKDPTPAKVTEDSKSYSAPERRI